MKELFVRDLVPNQKDVVGFFLVHQKDLRFNKTTGEGYLALQLGDRTGVVDAKMWDKVQQAPPFAVGDVIKVEATVQAYRNKPQLSIRQLRPAAEGEVVLGDFYRRSECDPEEMFRELSALVAGMADPHLQALLQSVLGDPEIAERFKRAPAAKSLHHAFLGGLLEHVLSLSRLCGLVVQNYPGIRRDLLLAGAVLHDVGKIYELSYDRGFHYTTKGHLLGHMFIGLEMVQVKIRAIPDFPAELKVLVEHIILSHHGEYEFGSPKLPMFPEALLLHYLDNLDAKMESMRAALQDDSTLEGDWTARVPALERMLLKVDKYLESEEEEK